jgi:signal transduction protein with GAF and PtsI domain
MELSTIIGDVIEPCRFLCGLIDGMFNGVIKLKKLIKAALNLHPSLILTDTFDKFVKEICTILDCDRASVFLIDHRRDTLWTKSAIGTKTIVINMNQGLASYTAKTGETLNILDAYQDERFN